MPITKSGNIYKVGVQECDISLDGDELKFEIKGSEKLSFEEFQTKFETKHRSEVARYCLDNNI